MSAGPAVEVVIVVALWQGSAASKDLGILVDRLGMAGVYAAAGSGKPGGRPPTSC